MKTHEFLESSVASALRGGRGWFTNPLSSRESAQLMFLDRVGYKSPMKSGTGMIVTKCQGNTKEYVVHRHGGAALGHATIAVVAAAIVMYAGTAAFAGDPFADSVIEYQPAPGQFVNNAVFNDPAMALGPPIGAGLGAADNTSVVTLGGFGGYIILAFDEPVEDHPLNPFGMDAVIFGNAFYVGSDPNRHWAECATIEISRDDNHNGLADDAWYLIPGSHNPRDQWLTLTWDDDIADATYPPGSASWIPPGFTGVWTTGAYELSPAIFGSSVVENPGAGVEGIYGYADYSPTVVLGDLDGDGIVDDPTLTPADFYVVPDDPLTIGVTLGSGGGDAIDIAWAIDPKTGEPAHLSEFDFVRITSPVNVIAALIGEKSPEIDAVSDVAPDFFGDIDEDSDIDLADVADLQICFDLDLPAGPYCAMFDRQGNADVDNTDAADVLRRMTGPLQSDRQSDR